MLLLIRANNRMQLGSIEAFAAPMIYKRIGDYPLIQDQTAVIHALHDSRLLVLLLS